MPRTAPLTEFFRNRTLNATDRYATFNPPEWRHQFGGTVGGPIEKDKLFYFLNAEIVRRNFPGENRIINNSFTDTKGVILPSSCTATAAQCASAIAFLQKQMDVLVTRNVHSAMGFGKIDWNLSPRNTFSFDLNAMHWASPHGIQTQSVLTSGNLLGNNGNSTVETRYGKASWTAIASSNIVNEFRFGWFKDRLSDPAASDLWPAETGPLTVTIAGSNVGAANAYPRTLPSENRLQFVENLSWISGAHSAKFGVDTQTTHDWMNQLFRGAGEYTYSSLTNFARDFSRQCRWREKLLQLPTGLRKPHSRVQNLGHQPVRARYMENQPPVYLELRFAMGKGFSASARKERPDASRSGFDSAQLPADGRHPVRQPQFCAALKSGLFHQRQDRRPCRLWPLLCAYPRTIAGYALPWCKQIPGNRFSQQYSNRCTRLSERLIGVDRITSGCPEPAVCGEELLQPLYGTGIAGY